MTTLNEDVAKKFDADTRRLLEQLKTALVDVKLPPVEQPGRKR